MRWSRPGWGCGGSSSRSRRRRWRSWRAHFALAASRAGKLLLENPYDGPLLLLLSRASTALVQSDRVFDPVWEPPGK